jgi:hypothetical protein
LRARAKFLCVIASEAKQSSARRQARFKKALFLVARFACGWIASSLRSSQ